MSLNFNTNYNKISRGGGTGFVGLFDTYGYPAFGASMRLLGANYTGGLVRLRAFDGSADQGTADVMPYKIGNEYWVDLNSTLENLDATATGRGLTTSDTLGDLVAAGGANYDGFVTTIFDQSLNGNHFLQGTAARQGKIINAGSLILENGKPIIQRSLDRNGGYLASGLNFVGDTNLYGWHYVGKRPGINDFNIFGAFDGAGSDYGYFATNGGTSTIVNNLVNASKEILNGANWIYTNRGDVYNDLANQSLISSQIQFNFLQTGYCLGYRFSLPLNFGMADFQENLIFNDNSNAAGINLNINNAFSIY